MPKTCIACSSYAKFWVVDGTKRTSPKKPVCNYHKIGFELLGHTVIARPMSRSERGY